MTEDTQSVQPGAVPEGTPSPAAVTPPEPSQEEKLATLIEQKVATAVAQATETAKREIQSIKDRSRVEIEKIVGRAKLTEGTLGAARHRLQELDPEAAKELELSELRAKEAGRVAGEQEEAQEEAQRQAQTALAAALQKSLFTHLEALGIDPKDKRLDWAQDATDYVQGRSRFDTSVAKIITEEKQTMQASLEKRLKDLETAMSKASIEANSVNTTTSPGVVAGSDAEFVKKFASGELPLTNENVKRYEKITETY